MLITEDEAKDLKTWVIKKLEDMYVTSLMTLRGFLWTLDSDADSDVLADYVLALIRADTPEPELRANAIENLEDFLKQNTTSFVDETFTAIRTKAYIPGYIVPPAPVIAVQPFTAPTGPAVYGSTGVRGEGYDGGGQQSRKRSYNDRHEERAGHESHYGRGDRQMKSMRRSDMGNGRGGPFQGRPDRDFQNSTNMPEAQFPSSTGFPGMPMPPVGMPFDPNDPIGAMFAMQAMGFPPLPGMPTLAQAASPTGYSQPEGQSFSGSPTNGNGRIRSRCRDYDTKGVCTRGNSCPYEHGNHIVVPSQQEEYDPNNSVMMDIHTPTRATNSLSNSTFLRGTAQDRGRGRGRGDRGGQNGQRRNRADFSQAGPNHDRSITTVVVEQIPEESFDEKAVREFFSDFGKIDEVSMQAYKRLALVKYEDYQSAKRAYESPKVIFDNRFVKVYWYNPNTVPTVPTNGTAAKAASPTTSSKPEEPAFDREKFERDSLAAQKKLEERKALQRETEAKRKEIEQQKEELDRKKADEKKKLEDKLRAKGLSLDDIGLETSSDTSKVPNGTPNGKASAHTEALRAQLAKLEEEARSMGLDPNEAPYSRGRGRGRGRGSYRGWEGFAGRGAGFDSSRGGYRGRGGPRGGRGGGAYNLDNRSKKIKVEGLVFDEDKDEGMRHFLIGIGEFENIKTSASKDSQVITFKDRFTAEKLMYGPKDIPGVGKVEFSWINTPLPPVVMPAAKHDEDGVGDADMDMGGVTADSEDGRDIGAGGHHGHGQAEVDYDVAEEDERWMVS
ncbi:hypothetical protein MMC27_007263 [Xylographa pallens]|nr:hypothetical protein [Xylographa pallens]